MVPDRVERELLIDAPIEVVWEVISDPAHVSGWFGQIAEIDLRPGGRMTHAWKEEGSLTEERGIVEKVEPPVPAHQIPLDRAKRTGYPYSPPPHFAIRSSAVEPA